MRLGTSRVVGVRVGEIKVDLIRDSAIEVTYAFVRDDGATCGKVTIPAVLSEATRESLRGFVEALEADVFSELFQGPAGPAESEQEAETQSEPRQF